MTGQDWFDSYESGGAVIAAELVNELAIDKALGRPFERAVPLEGIRWALETDPGSAARVRPRDVAGLTELALSLRNVFAKLREGRVDAAARQLNRLLATCATDLHLAKEHGLWRLHHHPADAALVPMVTAMCAQGLARLVAAGEQRRAGTCNADTCDRVFLDGSKNASRRFCSTTCQNRVKAASFRQRQAAGRG